METLFHNILDLLIQPPGNLIYHLVLAFSVISSLQAATIGRQYNTYPHTRRMVFGLWMLLAGQAVLFLSSGLAWQGIVDRSVFLPLLDRAVVVFSLVWIVWLWNFPAPAKLGDLITGFLCLGVILVFLFSYSDWAAQGQGRAFNNSSIDMIWELAAVFVVLTGMFILLFTRPAGWGFGMGMLALSLAGFIAHYLLDPAQGDLSGYIRLGQLAAFPLLPTLLNRFTSSAVVEQREAAGASSTATQQPATNTSPAIEPPRAQERRRYSAGPRAVHAWLELSETSEPDKILPSMAKAIATTMLADMCFVVNGPSYGHVVLQGGYDLIREEEMKGTMLEQSRVPMLANALQRSRALRVTVNDSQPADMSAISTALGLNEPGSLLFIPISADEKPQGGILLLSPYSNRQWSADDQGYLTSEFEMIARILRRAQQPGAPLARQAGQVDLPGSDLRVELEGLQQENQKLASEIAELRKNGPAIKPTTATIPMELSALVALQEETQEQIAILQAENERLHAALSQQDVSSGPSQEEFKRLEGDLRATLLELATLQNELAEANVRYLELEREKHPELPLKASTDNQEVVTSIVQEMRQPMSSILGYTDLLLAESVGILGALQRKFLERIKASTERMHSMIDDLIQVTAKGQGSFERSSHGVDLVTLIDQAVSDTSAQLREKNIALRVDLPQEMPSIQVDRDAIEQVIIHLLQNAGTVTPQEGAITLRARIQAEQDQDYLLLQITDLGGGIRPEDLPRVFARRYRAEMPLIQGLGDTGVGLSIASTLVEAHGGRIWVDSQPGQSTTFSVLLPVELNSANAVHE